MSQKKITLLFPIYNESENINRLMDEVYKLTAEIEKKYSTEIIFVNDGSRDNSLELLISLQKTDKRIRVFNLSRNFGHQIAVTAGLDNSKGDAVIILDSDLQDPPQVSLELIQKWEEGFDVVYAQRRTRKDGFIKKLTAYLFYRFLDAMAEIKIPKDTGDFRLIDRKVVEAMKACKEKNRFLRGMVTWVGFKQVAVQFDRHERYAGKTGYTLKKMLKLATDGITGFSMVPFKILTNLGLFGIAVSLLTIVFSVVARFANWYLGFGYAHLFIVGLVCFTSATVLFALGVIGEYIGRIYSEVLDRPLYFISDVYQAEENM